MKKKATTYHDQQHTPPHECTRRRTTFISPQQQTGSFPQSRTYRRGKGWGGMRKVPRFRTSLQPDKGDKDTVSVAEGNAVRITVRDNVKCMSGYILKVEEY